MKITLDLTPEQVKVLMNQLAYPHDNKEESTLSIMPRLFPASRKYVLDLFEAYGYAEFNTSCKRANEIKHANMLSNSSEIIKKMERSGFVKIIACAKGIGVVCRFTTKPY